MHRRLSDVAPATDPPGEQGRAARLKQWLLGQPRATDPPLRIPLADPDPGKIGIACSGGGVRSAAYNLGALQVLREKGVFGLDAQGRPPTRDVLVSAVSGGSYIASSFAAVAHTSKDEALAPRDGADVERGGRRVPRRVFAPSSPEEVHLRNNSAYLAPGLGGKLRLGLRVLMGMLVNFAVIGVVVAAVGAGLGALYGEAFDEVALASATGPLHPPTLAWLVPIASLGLGAGLLLPDLFKRLNHDEVRRFCEAWATRLIVLGLALGAVLLAVPQLILWIRGLSPPLLVEVTSSATPASAEAPGAARATSLLQTVNLGAILTAAAGALRAFVARKRSYFAIAAGAIAGPLVLLAPVMWVANATAVGGFGAGDVELLAGLAMAGFVTWLAVDLNQWSLHTYYRRRLSSAFFVGRQGPDSVKEWPYDKPLRVSEVDAGGRFPKLIVCAAANVSDQGATPPGRNATPFTFCKEDIGGPLVGACPTPDYEQRALRASRDVTLPAAVAMSGAAFSPVMGKKSIRAISLLLALTNLRLGVWLPNPRHLEALAKPRLDGAPRWMRSVPRAVEATAGKVGHSLLELARTDRVGPDLEDRCLDSWARVKAWALGRRPGPHYLFKEMLGRTKLHDRFLYVTDGGHFDNLGVVELLRRGCTTIYCLDAGGDPPGTYTALGEAIALARSELQVLIDIDPSPIDPPTEGARSATDHVVGRIRYLATPSGKGEVACDAGDVSPFVGRILYCRATVTDQAPFDVRAFQDKDRRFPHHSTFDQLFDDQKFESYRALGAHTAALGVETLRRQELRDAIRDVLVSSARRRATICHADLIVAVQQTLCEMGALSGELGDADRRLFRSLLDEVAALEAEAHRPPLSLVVQERRALDAQKRLELDTVWDYWSPGVAPVEDRTAPVAALLTGTRALLRAL